MYVLGRTSKLVIYLQPENFHRKISLLFIHFNYRIDIKNVRKKYDGLDKIKQKSPAALTINKNIYL